MTTRDRRSIANGKPSAPPKLPAPPPVTWGEWVKPEHNHRPVTRGELKAYGDVLGEAILQRQADNRWWRVTGRWLAAWWRFLLSPRAKGADT